MNQPGRAKVELLTPIFTQRIGPQPGSKPCWERRLRPSHQGTVIVVRHFCDRLGPPPDLMRAREQSLGMKFEGKTGNDLACISAGYPYVANTLSSVLFRQWRLLRRLLSWPKLPSSSALRSSGLGAYRRYLTPGETV